MSEITIIPMVAEDWPTVREIYLQGISTGNATFETGAPGWENWNAGHLPSCRLVARSAGVSRGRWSRNLAGEGAGDQIGGNCLLTRRRGENYNGEKALRMEMHDTGKS